MTAKKGLQKLTEFERKFNSIIELKKISNEDLKAFTAEEKDEFLKLVLINMYKKEQYERDKSYLQIEDILGEDLKNQLWDNNHVTLIRAMTKHIDECGRMPSVMELATETKISRQTIYKHLKSFANHPIQLAYNEQFKFMCNKVLGVVCKLALCGDVSAAKLFLNCMNSAGDNSVNKTIIQNQNNYVQVNELVLSQDTIKKMNPEQLAIIEKIVLSV